MKYKINDKIEDLQEYIKQCIDIKKLDDLKAGDEIITFGNYNRTITRFIFKQWMYCKWRTNNLGPSCCGTCNGTLAVENENDIESLCIGSSQQPDKSLILKITKKVKLLEDDLFEI